MPLGGYPSGCSRCWLDLVIPTHGTTSASISQPVFNPESIELGSSFLEEESDVTLYVFWT